MAKITHEYVTNIKSFRPNVGWNVGGSVLAVVTPLRPLVMVYRVPGRASGTSSET